MWDYIKTSSTNLYEYFLPVEKPVDYTDIPDNVKNQIENHCNGGLTNEEKQKAVDEYTNVDKEFAYQINDVKNCCQMTEKCNTPFCNIKRIEKKRNIEFCRKQRAKMKLVQMKGDKVEDVVDVVDGESQSSSKSSTTSSKYKRMAQSDTLLMANGRAGDDCIDSADTSSHSSLNSNVTEFLVEDSDTDDDSISICATNLSPINIPQSKQTKTFLHSRAELCR